MSSEIVYIGFGENSKLVKEDFSHTIIFSQKEGDIFISGGSIDEIEKDFSAKKETFLKKLIEYYQIFKRKKTTNIRYLLFSSLDENIGVSIPLEVAETIYKFHIEVIHMPCSIEGIFLLPSLKANKKEKANCYAFLEKLDELIVNNNKKFNFLWLLDTNYFPISALKEIFDIYLSTDIYAQFHAQAEANILKGKFLERPTAYSTLGILKLIFPVEKWQKYLSLKLKKDILTLTRLSLLEPTIDIAKLAVSAWSSFFEKTNLPETVDFITSYKKLEGEKEILEGLLKETEEVEEIINRFFGKLEHATNQEISNIWEEKLKQHSEEFFNYLKKEIEDILDKDSHGPFNALAFITLILNTNGPYTHILKKVEQKEEIPLPTTLSGYLFGMKGKESSEVLKIIFNEIIDELKIIYSKHFIPLPEIKDWDSLWNEFERLTNLSEFTILFGNDKERILELKEITQIIKNTSKRPYSNPLTSANIKKILSILEKEDKRQLKQLADEVKSIEEKFNYINNQIKNLGWRKYLPYKWGLFLDKKEIEKERIKIRNKLKEKALLMIEKKKRLIPCYTAIFFYEKLREKINPLEKEIKEFVNSLINELQNAEKEMENIFFESNELNKQIVEKTDENILKLYHTQFSSQDIPENIFEKEFFSFLKVLKIPSKISSFYSKDKREQFFEMLSLFCLNKFAWLLDWNIEKVLIYLGKVEEALYTLESSCIPFLKIKEYPEEKVRQCLYIGIEDETITKLNRSPYCDCLKGNHQFYSTKNAWEIVGLKIIHGFPLFVIEGWEHLKKCYEKEITEIQEVKDGALGKD